jgi:predicted TIM-barrel fold metal-dependent hydrolase
MASGRASHIDGKVMDFAVDDSDEVLKRFEADLVADGVSGAVIYPNNGMVAFLPDHELAMAHARVYNDYVVEVFGKHFRRYAPAAIIPLTDVGDAVAEVERVA